MVPDFSWGLVSVGLKSRGLFLTTEAKFGRFFLLLLQPFWQPDQWNDVERRRDWRRTLPGLTKLEPHDPSLALVLKSWPPSSSARWKIRSRSPKGEDPEVLGSIRGEILFHRSLSESTSSPFLSICLFSAVPSSSTSVGNFFDLPGTNLMLFGN